jgi:hypothetical protein
VGDLPALDQSMRDLRGWLRAVLANSEAPPPPGPGAGSRVLRPRLALHHRLLSPDQVRLPTL